MATVMPDGCFMLFFAMQCGSWEWCARGDFGCTRIETEE